MFKNLKILLIGIIILASILRLYQLGEHPISLFGDEIDAGYNAYSFLKTGKDYNGNFLPIHFESMGDYRPFGFILALVPSIAILGLNDFSVRLVPAIWGIIGIFLIFLLVNRSKLNVKGPSHRLVGLWPKLSNVAIMSALLLAITPWHIHYSRAAFEVTLMLSLILLGIYALYKSFNHPKWLFLTSISFAYSVYTYNVAKLYAPLLLIIFIIIYRRQILKINKQILVLAGLSFILLISPLIYDSFTGPGQNRFQSLNLLNTPQLIENINYSRGQISHWPPTIQRIFHNKAISVNLTFANNYLDSFSPKFLFISGQADIPRHSVENWGLLYLWMAPFLILGLFYLWKHRQQPFSQLLFAWLITAPIPSALTVNGGQHATRLFIMLPPLIIITALGIIYFFDLINPHHLSSPRRRGSIHWIPIFMGMTLSIIVLLSLTLYLQDYYFHYSPTHFRSWQYGLKPALRYAKSVEDQYQQIIITRSYIHLPMLYYLFYNQFPPHLLHQQFQQAQQQTILPPTEQIGKYRFLTITAQDNYRPTNTLYIASPWDQPPGWNKIGQLDSPDPTDDKPLLLYLSSK